MTSSNLITVDARTGHERSGFTVKLLAVVLPAAAIPWLAGLFDYELSYVASRCRQRGLHHVAECWVDYRDEIEEVRDF